MNGAKSAEFRECVDAGATISVIGMNASVSCRSMERITAGKVLQRSSNAVVIFEISFHVPGNPVV